MNATTRLNEHLHPGAVHRRVLLLAWGAWFTGFYTLMLLSFLLPQVQAEFGLSERELAWMTGIAVGASGAGGVLFGWMSDRWGRRASLGVAIAAFSLGNLLAAASPSSLALILARALAGLGVGGTWGAGQAMIGETFPPARRGRYGAVAQSGAPCGLGTAAAIGSFVAPVIGWRTTFLLSVAPVVALFFLRAFPESDLWLEHRRRLRDGTLARAEREAARRPILAQLVGRDLRGRFAGAFLLTILNMSAYWFAVIWLPRYLQVQRGLSIFGSGWWTLTFVAGSLLGYLTFGAVSDAIGRRRAFTLYCAITAAGLAVVTIFWEAFQTEPAVALGSLFVAGVGTGTWSCFGAYFTELFPTRVRGAALAVIMNASRGAQFLAPPLIAVVGAGWGLGGGVALAAGFAALAGIWVWTLPETRGTRIEAGAEPAAGVEP